MTGNKTAGKTDITKDIRTEVEVKIAPMVIALADLVLLKKLADGERNCYDRKAERKLLFLGLVVEGDLPPCPKAVVAWEAQQVMGEKDARKALEKRDWKALGEAYYSLRHDKPKETRGLIVTAAGMRLLKTGVARSMTVKTKGC